MERISIYDTTLRDGTQGEGVSLSVEDKVKIALRLDEMGISYIEGGWPGSTPKDSQFFERARGLRLSHAKLTAFGSTRRPNSPTPDATLQAVLDAGTDTVALFGKSWILHVDRVLRTTPDENLRMIGDSVEFFRRQGREVIYDAEHFFDGYKDDPEYAFATLRAAKDAGADWIVLCDTNGGTLTDDVSAIVKRIVREIGGNIGIHTHNDSELAVANTLAAVNAGARQVQGTINGYGERTGNANLCSIIPNLQSKMGYRCVEAESLERLTELSRYVAEVANLSHDSKLPYVGASSFAHKAGMHVNAVLKATESFEHLPPETVGNRRRILVSELSGRSNILYNAQQFGVDMQTKAGEVRTMVDTIKRLEHEGYQFEGAEASFELLVRRTQPGYSPPFELSDLLVLVEKRTGLDLLAEATVKVRIGSEVFHTVAEGNGPVNALDAAIRKALLNYFPDLEEVQLSDYKVRVIDGDAATAAAVRVSIESTDGRGTWSTVGSSANIIEASWLALADSLEYGLLRIEERKSSEAVLASVQE